MLLSDRCAWLERCYDILNDIYFSGSLPPVVITIMSDKKAYGYITVKKVWNTEGDMLHEINISAEFLCRSIENILATLVHEQTHLYCMENKIADTSKGGKYHNKKFKEEAEKRDLKIEYHQYIGYSVTSPTEKFISVIKEQGLYEADNNFYRSGGVSGGSDIGGNTGSDDDRGGKPRGHTRKYLCMLCDSSVRATKDVNIICGDCGIAFLKV